MESKLSDKQFIFMHPCSFLIKDYLFEVPCVCCFGRALFAGTKQNFPFWDLFSFYLHNSDKKITSQKHKKQKPSKGEGKTAMQRVNDNREWWEGKIVVACLRYVTKENSPRLPRFYIRTSEEYPVWPEVIPRPEVGRCIRRKLHKIIYFYK